MALCGPYLFDEEAEFARQIARRHVRARAAPLAAPVDGGSTPTKTATTLAPFV